MAGREVRAHSFKALARKDSGLPTWWSRARLPQQGPCHPARKGAEADARTGRWSARSGRRAPLTEPHRCGGELRQASCSNVFSAVKAAGSRDAAQWGWGERAVGLPRERRTDTTGDRDRDFTGRGMSTLRLNFPKGRTEFLF